MIAKRTRASGTGLERLCAQDWMRSTDTECGVELLEARLHGHAYQKHRHDTYAVCLTTAGVLAFDYRGTTETSVPGQVVVLHPDEPHDGYAGDAAGFGYRELYVHPALLFEAIQALLPGARTLPFVRGPVTDNRKLAAAVKRAFESPHEPLAMDSLILQLADGLTEAGAGYRAASRPRHLDATAVRRARQYLDAQHTRAVHSSELEAVTGLNRYALARHFRIVCGTSPYRYLLMRRLDHAREQLGRGPLLADVALDTGFADQAHFSRAFKGAFGITPATYRALNAPGIETEPRGRGSVPERRAASRSSGR
jgi:AraC-like DNA-binding protein